MDVNYRKLWDLLIDKNMLKKDLKKKANLSTNALAKLGKNEHVSTEVLIRICKALKCEIQDILDFENEEKISKPKKPGKYKVIELFAGAGGLALGLEKSGFSSVGLIELDKNACETLKANRKYWNVVHDDIANISSLNLENYFGIKKGELDLLSGGAPCQSFSYAGKRLGLEDARGTLFYHYAVFLEKLKP